MRLFTSLYGVLFYIYFDDASLLLTASPALVVINVG